jgi:PAS domain-containing protein
LLQKGLPRNGLQGRRIQVPPARRAHPWKRAEVLKENLAAALGIVDTVREPLVVLNSGLRVVSANRLFYKTFRVTPEETEKRHIYEVGSGQWDIPALRQMLAEVLSKRGKVVEHDFPISDGRRCSSMPTVLPGTRLKPKRSSLP